MKKTISRIIFHPLTAVVLTIIGLFILMQNHQRLKRLDIARQNIQQAEQEVEAAEEELLQVETALEEAQEPLAQETLLRDSLLMQREGELVIKLPEISIVEEEAEREQIDEGNWQAWMEVVF